MPTCVTVFAQTAPTGSWVGGPSRAGMTVPVVQAVASLTQELAALYGDNVEVRLVDTLTDDLSAYPDAERQIQLPETMLPVVAIDGQVVAAGGFSLGRILAELDRLGVERGRR